MGIKQRLYPDPGHAGVLVMHCDHARFIYNLGLEQRRMWHPFKRETFKVNYNSQARELTEARREYPWLAEGATTVQQGALRDLDLAYRSWWANPSHFGAPTFRSRDQRQGFIVRDLTVRRLNRKWATVSVPKAGAVKFRLTRPWAEVQSATSARITCTPAGTWYLALTTLPAVFERTSTGAVVGIDRGVAQTISTSEGTHQSIPTLRPGEQRRFLTLERKLARQVKGSARRECTKRKLNRIRDKLGNRRQNWVEQTSTSMVRDYDLIALEKLATANMVRKVAPKPDPENPGTFLPNGAAAKSGLNRAIHASCWGMLAARLKDKSKHSTDGHRAVVVEVDPRNTSRTCHECGHTSKENRKSQAVFHCQRCGHTAHADTNAAKNILARAINTLPPDGRPMDASATSGCRVKPEKAALPLLKNPPDSSAGSTSSIQHTHSTRPCPLSRETSMH